MPNTNMDLKKKSNPDGPQLEFTLPITEVMEDLKVGQRGLITIPCEVTQVSEGYISFRKAGQAKSEGKFAELTASEMRATLPEAER